MWLIPTAAGFGVANSHPEQCTHNVALVLTAMLRSRVTWSLIRLETCAAEAAKTEVADADHGALSVLLPSAATTAEVELQPG